MPNSFVVDVIHVRIWIPLAPTVKHGEQAVKLVIERSKRAVSAETATMAILIKLAGIILLTIPGSTAWAECNPIEAEIGIRRCRDNCNVTNNKIKCAASRRMSFDAKNRNVLGVRIGFDDCLTENDATEIKQRSNAEKCLLDDPSALLQAACKVYGCTIKRRPGQ